MMIKKLGILWYKIRTWDELYSQTFLSILKMLVKILRLTMHFGREHMYRIHIEMTVCG